MARSGNRGCTYEASTPPATARAGWRSPVPRTGRSSRPRCRPPGAGARVAAGAHALLRSLILRSPPSLLPLIAAVAVCDVVGVEARIKWPNDIVLERGRDLAKLAGILAEGRPQEGWAILGIGLNVSVGLEELPAELRARTATLGEPRERIEPTLKALLDALERRLAEREIATLEAWRARDALRGREIVWGTHPTGSPGHGRAEGIDGTGRLVVALAEGGHTALDAGEVHLQGT